jgi:hypothetical protein
MLASITLNSDRYLSTSRSVPVESGSGLIEARTSAKARPWPAMAPMAATPIASAATRAHSALASSGRSRGAWFAQRPSSSIAWSGVSSSTRISSALTDLARSARRVLNSTVPLGASPVSASSWRASHTLSIAISVRLPRRAAESCSRPCSLVLKVIAALSRSRPTARSASSASGCFPGPASSQTIPSRKARRISRSAHA